MMNRITLRSPGQQQGFTVIELMMATAVFSVILLLIATAIIQITRVYYKGITETTTQTTARSIVDTLSQNIQFGGGTVTPTNGSPSPGASYAFCIGDKQFSYQVGYQLSDSPSSQQRYHGLVMRDLTACEGQPPSTVQDMNSPSVSGRELLGRNMRLSKLTVENVSGNLYRITVKVVYGADDVLTNPGNPDTKCQSIQSKAHFCGTAELSTLVTKRVE